VSRRDRAPAPERELITRTWRRIALQTAALFAVGVIALAAVAVGVVLHIAHNDATRQLTQAMNDPDALTNPPIDISVYELTDGHLRASPGALPGPPDPRTMAAGSGPDALVERGGHEYLVRTQRQGASTIQVAFDLSDQENERHRLFVGLAVAAAVGMVLSGGFGALIARRAIAPLGHAMVRQQRFVADASHELRTPLTQLHTRAQLLERELRHPGDSARIRDDVNHLVRGTRQMGELLDELLVAAAVRSEPQRRDPVDLDVLASETVEAEGPRASQRRVQVTIERDGAGPYVVGGTEPALRRVLASLVDNALGHTPAGGRITIELSVEDKGRTVQTRVRDSGEGFSPGDAERLFERFYRGEHGNGRRFGLGLSLVREVVVAHGGTVTASGNPGAGACFTIRMPSWSGETADSSPDQS
jgi:signal transduction histidine kinase